MWDLPNDDELINLPYFCQEFFEDSVHLNSIQNDINDGTNVFSDPIQNSNPTVFNTNKECKEARRDYYIKNIKVLALSQWLISEINLHLREIYKIKQKIQKPSQSFITETNIKKNQSWLYLSIEQILTKNFEEYYPQKQKNLHWEKKREKNIKIFALLHKKHNKEFTNDPIFKRTMENVLIQYINSDQFLKDKKKKKSLEEQLLFDLYANGDSNNSPSIVDYFLKTPGNEKKK